MGHYASEMDPNFGQETNIDRARKSGFTRVNSVHFEREAVECDTCGAIVLDWEKHRSICWLRGKGPKGHRAPK